MLRAFLFIFIIFTSTFIDYKIINFKDLQSENINVSIIGAVDRQGVYQVKRYSTINDVLQNVTLLPSADISKLNLNSHVKNNDVINVIEKTSISLISINNATAEQLDTLPGIGIATANKIVKYREENGLFQKIEDIMLVEGIKLNKYEKFKEYICL